MKFFCQKSVAKYVCVAFSAALLLTGCKGKDGDPGPAGANGTPGTAGSQGPSGQNLTGTMAGFVNPVDEYGNPTSKSGVVVTIEGVTPAVTVTSNVDGRYEFTNLRNGTYNLSYARAGLSTARRLGIGHVGGDQPTFLGTFTISGASTTTFGTFSATSSAGLVQMTIPYANPGTPTGSFTRFAIFASASPGVTAANGIYITTLSASSSPYNVAFSRATFNNAGFATGTPVYLVVYGAPSLLTSYADPLTGRPVFIGLSVVPSNQAVTTVP